MKKGIVIGLLLGIALALVVGAAVPQAPKYWQDLIQKPDQEWIEAYGYNNESVLAFNVRRLLQVQNFIAQEMMTLKAQVKTLSDPNTP